MNFNTMETQIKIALADDEVLFRQAIAFLLQRNHHLQIIFEASNGQELISFLRESPIKPNIVIVDLKMPVLNGVETTKIIRQEFPDVKIIALTSYNGRTFIANVIDVGAVAYLMKNTTPQELIEAIEKVHSKGYYYSDDVLSVINECLLSPDKSFKKTFSIKLTNREKDVLQLLCKQYSNAEIAKKLFLSIRTVEGHRNNLFQKTECKNIVGLIIFAIQNDYFSLDEIT